MKKILSSFTWDINYPPFTKFLCPGLCKACLSVLVMMTLNKGRSMKTETGKTRKSKGVRRKVSLGALVDNFSAAGCLKAHVSCCLPAYYTLLMTHQSPLWHLHFHPLVCCVMIAFLFWRADMVSEDWDEYWWANSACDFWATKSRPKVVSFLGITSWTICLKVFTSQFIPELAI